MPLALKPMACHKAGTKVWRCSGSIAAKATGLRVGSSFQPAHGLSVSTHDHDEEYRVVGVLEPTNSAFGRPVVWSYPAFANRRLYVRNDKEIVCVSLAK